jgi:hypothetical protein
MATSDAVKTYRYLRIGMIGAVVLLATSIAIEHDTVGGCWQNSISAYYYTPVRAIFVGGMLVVGFALIVIKGRGAWEDACLNAAGMLAPVVAVVPTTDIDACWSQPPNPLPLNAEGVLQPWVVANIDNNVKALLIAGFLGLGVAFLTVVFVNKSVLAPVRVVERGTSLSLVAAFLLLSFAWLLFAQWDDFDTGSHGKAASLMFVFLIGAVVGKAVEHRGEPTKGYFPLYTAIGSLMVIGGALIVAFRVGGEHTVFVLEATEIALFAVFWGVQTAENWNETV